MKKVWLFILLAVPVAYGQANLKNPSALKERAPAVYKVKFDTSAGVFEVEVHADWAPNGADRFYNLVKNGYYDGCRFFRVVPGFMVQFGINGDPATQRNWVDATIPDEPVKQGNGRGLITFAKSSAPNTAIAFFGSSYPSQLASASSRKCAHGWARLLAKVWPISFASASASAGRQS